MTRSVLCFLTAALLLCTASSTATAAVRKALLIGIDDYPANSRVPRLRYAVSDVRALAAVLMESGYAAGDIVVLESAATEESGFCPTRENILQHLRRLATAAGSEDDSGLLVVFVGHGFNDRGDSRLCPLDFLWTDRDATSLRLSDVSRILAESPAPAKCLVVDACREELEGGEDLRFNLLSGLHQMVVQGGRPQGMTYMASCLAGQVSMEDDKLRGGVFMSFFTAGLRGEADVTRGGSRDGHISPYEAMNYASKQTMDFTQAELGWKQVPWMEGRGTVELDLAEVPAARLRQLITQASQQEGMDESPGRLHAEQRLELALEALARDELAETQLYADEAIAFDGKYAMARRTRALVATLTGDYPTAVEHMRAIDRPLPVRIAQPLVIVDSSGRKIATANPQQTLEIDSVELVSGQSMARVVAGFNESRLATSPAPEPGYVAVQALKGAVQPVDQVVQFRNSTGRGQRLDRLPPDPARIAAAIATYHDFLDPIRGTVPGGGWIPSGAQIEMWRQKLEELRAKRAANPSRPPRAGRRARGG